MKKNDKNHSTDTRADITNEIKTNTQYGHTAHKSQSLSLPNELLSILLYIWKQFKVNDMRNFPSKQIIESSCMERSR